ncbi:AMP-binding protein [Brucella pituitosa]|uniref:3-methylmercaptopropionyl-CoA ligase n=1 Tax=Brucella intermedia GD04153 TaxID=2975438 RepID=A0AA42KQU9_9HYPH|nr:AMP-binding protein [Brucella intermedia]MDH0126851.1 AMP-binding protein [Brucella intermedia GD04153]RRD22399.1 acyl-CoA synthetase [Brucellaceae bacterium VT-16-1752]
MGDNIYNMGLDRNPANFTQLSPLSFLSRAADVFPLRKSVIYDDRSFTWTQTLDRCSRLASALKGAGIGQGCTVSTLLPNVPAMYEAHFGVPAAGAVLNTINTRIDAGSLAFILEHSETKLVLVDPELVALLSDALDLLEAPHPIIVNVADAASVQSAALGDLEYEDFLATAQPLSEWPLPENEWDAIALGYTSGTTGDPKGVVTHHRGAFLNAISNTLISNVPPNAVYLWTLPMFHCNGWCFPWTLAMVGGTNICLRRVDGSKIVDLMLKHGVTNYCGAPVVHSLIAEAAESTGIRFQPRVAAWIAGAAPSKKVFMRLEERGVDLFHAYGLTETYALATICTKQPEWLELNEDERATLNNRQGVRPPTLQDAMVLDPVTMQPVPWDGITIGEVMFRGNTIMKGYLKNPSATEEAFQGGWFHSGDLGVQDAQGYILIKDRSKDIIISGGENISSIEVEEALMAHAEIRLAAVVAMPDEKWGEVPAAFVELQPHSRLDEAEIIRHCMARLAKYKVPKKVVLGPISVTPTGKIQKYALRTSVA